jgi:hypothetical protein
MLAHPADQQYCTPAACQCKRLQRRPGLADQQRQAGITDADVAAADLQVLHLPAMAHLQMVTSRAAVYAWRSTGAHSHIRLVPSRRSGCEVQCIRRTAVHSHLGSKATYDLALHDGNMHLPEVCIWQSRSHAQHVQPHQPQQQRQPPTWSRPLTRPSPKGPVHCSRRSTCSL